MAEIFLTFAWLHLKQINWNKSLYFAKKANIEDKHLIAPYFFEAANYMIQSQYLSALEYFRTIRVLFPLYKFKSDEKIAFQSALWKELISLYRDNLFKNGVKTATEAIELFPRQPVFYTFKAKFLYSCNHIDQSLRNAKQALKLNPYSLKAVILLRRILLEKNQYKEAFSIWERLVPKEIIYGSENLIRNRYIKLRKAFKNADPDKQKSLIALASTLIQAGWEKEAQIVYKKISGMKKEKKKLKRHLEFMENFKALIYSCYKTRNTNIVDLITHINKLAKKSNIPLRIRPSKILNSYFIMIREADPFNPQGNSLGRYLKVYNKILDIGNNYGYLEVRLMNRLSVKKYKRNIFGQKLNYNVIIGDETQIDNYIGYYSGSAKVAGRAFFSKKGFYISLDSIRPSFISLKNTYKQIFLKKKKDLNSSLLRRSLKNIFLPDSEKKWEILYKEIIKRSIDMVHNHELGHVFDFYCFLPVYKSLGNIFSMLWTQSFSPQQIQTRFETVADIFGLVHTKYPYYYLSQLMERLDTDFTGIFELVYWAWYGKLPQEDAYYLTSKQISNKFKELTKSNKSMAQYSKKDLKKILLEIFNKIGTQKNCIGKGAGSLNK